MRKEVVFALLLIIAVIALLSFSNRFSQASEIDARKFFAEDLARNYPDADIREILSSVQVGEGPSAYYLLSARVSYNLSTPCPTRLEVEYYYPPQSFVARRPQVLVGNCQICGGSQQPCVLPYMEEAIIASHKNPEAKKVREFISLHPNAIPSVALLPEWNKIPSVWEVNWTAQEQGLSVHILQANGQIVDISEIQVPQTQQ
jgi:hypothetical protein